MLESLSNPFGVIYFRIIIKTWGWSELSSFITTGRETKVGTLVRIRSKVDGLVRDEE